MLKPVPMARVAVVGPKSQLAATIEALHQENLLHIEDYSATEPGFQLGNPLPHGSKVSERLLRVRGVLKSANVSTPERIRPFTEANLKSLESKLSEVEEELAHLVEERNKALDETKRLSEESAVLERVRNFPIDLQYLAGYRSLAIAAGIVPPETDLAPLQNLHAEAEVAESEEVEGRFVAVFVPRAEEKRLQDALGKMKFETLDLPKTPGRPADQLRTIRVRKEQLSEKVSGLEFKIAQIRDRHAGALLALDEYLSIEAEKATSPVRFRTTRNSFMIEGWVPRVEVDRLRASVERLSGGLAFVTELAQPPRAHGAEHAGEHDEEPQDVPVKYRNWRPSGAYELLTDTYARPKYRELDPTLFFYLGFPLFYGIMLGDVGYAVLLLLMVWTGVFSKVFDFFGFKSHWHLNRIILHSALMSLLFGLLYAEFFGIEFIGPALDEHGEATHAWIHYEAHWGAFTFPLARFHNVKLLLALSLAIAAIHMGIGLILGIRNATIAHGLGQAIKHRGSWLCILLGVTIIGIALLPPVLGLPILLPLGPVVGGIAGAIFLLGAVLLVMGEGPTALLELPTILSNLLSYTRLVAIGLSGAGIALAGNEVSKLGFELGGIAGIFIGVMLLLFFHLLNLALGIMGPAVHSLRLHYVEFFTKFYEGGGTPYAPFGAERKFTMKEVKQA